MQGARRIIAQPRKCACYDPGDVTMNVKRTATIVVVGGALAAWLAGAATSNRALAGADRSRSRTPIDTRGAALATEIARLHERLRPTAAPRAAGAQSVHVLARAPAPRVARRRSAARRRSPRRRRRAAAAAAAEARRHRRRSRRPTARCAPRSSRRSGQLFLVKEGDDGRRARYRVAKISADVVELTDVGDDTDPSPRAQVGRRARVATARAIMSDRHHHQSDLRRRHAARPARARAELASAVVDRARRCRRSVRHRARGHARELAKAAVARGARLVIAWGGDGTINEVASALAFDDVPLGIVPAGSGTGWRASSACSRGPSGRSPTRSRAEPRPIDVGELDGRLFVNIAGVGFDAHVAARFDEPATAAAASSATRGITARALLTYVPRHYRITTGGATRRRARRPRDASPTRAQFGNGARIAPGARVDDGLLDLVVVEERSRLAHALSTCRGCSTARVERVPRLLDPADRAGDDRERPADDVSRRRRAGRRAGPRLRAARPSGRAACVACSELSAERGNYACRAGRPRPRGRPAPCGLRRPRRRARSARPLPRRR